MPAITNIAAYKFAALAGLKELRQRLLARCKASQVKGTILLSPEGINLFVAGEKTAIELLLVELRSIPGLEELQPKFSMSDAQPFSRMLVKVKKEIIAFGVEGIDPIGRPAPKLDGKVLKQWLDEGRPVTLLDTRNDYEVKLGTFKNALPIGIDHFREFPAAVHKLPEELKKQPIVMFCTGGIRCEKAGPLMEREGFEQVYQLDGGILKYFEQCGSAHYEGECFVFDQRVGVDHRLRETSTSQCFACLTPLTAEEQLDPRYVPGRSCPYCFLTPEAQMQRTLAERRAAIARVTTPLPGGQPYANYRPIKVPAAYDGETALDFLCGMLCHVPRDEWLAYCEQGRILDGDRQVITAEHRVHAGDYVVRLIPENSEPDVNVEIEPLYEDEAIVVLRKPAPLPMHPSGRFNRNSLQFILNKVYAPQKLRPAHRLDANTAGVVVLTRTKYFAGLLQPQFERGEVEKVYLARVAGHPRENEFTCELPISSGAGNFGSRTIDEAAGQHARTDFRVLHRDADGTALLEVRPRTGRTNQIRVHLWQLGWPIRGDQAYLLDRKLGETQTHAVDDPPLCLFAWQIGFAHPLTAKRVHFDATLPEWAVVRG